MKGSLIIFLVLLTTVATVLADDKIIQSVDNDIVQVEMIQSHTFNFNYIHQAKYWTSELWLPVSDRRIRYGLGPSFRIFEKTRINFLIYGESKSAQILDPFLGGLSVRLILDDEVMKFYNETNFLFPLQKSACSQYSQENYFLLNLSKNSIGFEYFAAYYNFGAGIYENYIGPKFQRMFNKNFLLDLSLLFYEIKSNELVFINSKEILLKFVLKAKF